MRAHLRIVARGTCLARHGGHHSFSYRAGYGAVRDLFLRFIAMTMSPERGSSAGWLLDRTTELGVITAAVSSAVSGSGSVLLVEGVAGIGKTSLLRHACEQAALAGMTVRAARAAEFEGGYAWGVVRQLFEPEALAGGGRRLAGDAAALAAPALAHGASLGEEDPFSVLHGLYWLAAGIAQQAPLLLAVDDLHWADQPSLRFTAHLARRLEGLPVLLVLTVREPRPVPAEPDLAAGLAAEANVTVLRPAALGGSACAELVSWTLGGEPSAAFQNACGELTGGQPAAAAGAAGQPHRGGGHGNRRRRTAFAAADSGHGLPQRAAPARPDAGRGPGSCPGSRRARHRGHNRTRRPARRPRRGRGRRGGRRADGRAADRGRAGTAVCASRWCDPPFTRTWPPRSGSAGTSARRGCSMPRARRRKR